MNLGDLFRRWRALTHKNEMDQELDQEVQFHLEHEVERNVKSGMSLEEARYAALKSFDRFEQSRRVSQRARC